MGLAVLVSLIEGPFFADASWNNKGGYVTFKQQWLCSLWWILFLIVAIYRRERAEHGGAKHRALSGGRHLHSSEDVGESIYV